LHPRAGFGKGIGLLENGNRVAGSSKAECGSNTANAATSQGDFQRS
jgi:hypothetical protein